MDNTCLIVKSVNFIVCSGHGHTSTSFSKTTESNLRNALERIIDSDLLALIHTS